MALFKRYIHGFFQRRASFAVMVCVLLVMCLSWFVVLLFIYTDLLCSGW
jgi:hypothetical protein